MRKNPIIIGTAVPIARRRRNEDVFPAKKRRERVENRKAERPKPDTTIPRAVARWNEYVRRGDKLKGESRSHRFIRERLCCRVGRSCETGVSPCTGHVPAEGEETYCEGGDGFRGCGCASVEDVSDARITEKEEDEGRCEGYTRPSGVDNAAPYWSSAVHAD